MATSAQAASGVAPEHLAGTVPIAKNSTNGPFPAECRGDKNTDKHDVHAHTMGSMGNTSSHLLPKELGPNRPCKCSCECQRHPNKKNVFICAGCHRHVGRYCCGGSHLGWCHMCPWEPEPGDTKGSEHNNIGTDNATIGATCHMAWYRDWD